MVRLFNVYLNNKVKINYKLLIFTGLFIICTSQKISIGPDNSFVKQNRDVLFNCIIEDYDSKYDAIEWCKNDFCTWGRSVELSDGSLQFKSLPKYFIKGNRQIGNLL